MSLFAVLQYYNYRKELRINILGIFDKKELARKVFEASLKYCRDHCWRKNCAVIPLNENLKAMELGYPDEEEFMTFRLQEIKNCAGLDLSIPVYANLRYKLVIWGDLKKEPLGEVIDVFNDKSKCISEPVPNEIFYAKPIKNYMKISDMIVSAMIEVNKEYAVNLC